MKNNGSSDKNIITVIIMTYKKTSKEKKETVASTRKCLGKYAKKYLLFRVTRTTQKKSKTTTKRKNMYTTTAIDLYPRNG